MYFIYWEHYFYIKRCVTIVALHIFLNRPRFSVTVVAIHKILLSQEQHVHGYASHL